MKHLLGVFLMLSVPAWAQQTRPELVLQTGHTATVASLAVSAAGNQLISGGTDGMAKLWDAGTGALLYSLPHGTPVLAAKFNPDGTATTATRDGALRFWNPANGALTRQIAGSNLSATAAALSLDGSLAAFALPEGKILLRRTADGSAAMTLDGHPTRIRALAFDPSGKLLASTSEAYREKPANEEFARRAGDVRIWDIEAGDLVKTLRGHALSVHGVAWSPDGKKLASVGESGTAVIWDAQTFTKLREFNASSGKGRATSVTWSADAQQVLVGWRAGVQAWNVGQESGTSLWSQAETEAPASLSPLSGNRWAVALRSGTLEILNKESRVLPVLTPRSRALTGLCVSPDGKSLVSSSVNGTVYLWDSTRAELQRAWQAHSGKIVSLTLSPDGKVLATAGVDRTLKLWEMPAGRALKTLPVAAEVTALAFSADGKQLAAASAPSDGGYPVQLWDTATWKETRKLVGASGEVRKLAFAPNGALAAATARGSWGQLVVWDVTGKVALREFIPGLQSLALSADGNRLAAVGAYLDEEEDYAPAGDVVQIWNLRAGEKSKEWSVKAENAAILGGGFSADAKSLVTASRNGEVRLWDAAGASKVLAGHVGPVNAVTYVPGEPVRLASAGADGSVRLWDATSGRQLVTLVTLDEGSQANGQFAADWLAVMPEGYFNGSPGADRFLQWRLGPDVFPLAAFEAGYRKPEYVRAAAINHPLYGVRDGLGTDLPPQATITLPKAGDVAGTPLKVRVSATDDRALRNVQLFINGRPAVSQVVSGEAKPIEIGAKPIEIGAKPIEVGAKPIEVGAKPIPSGHNKEWAVDLSAPLPLADGAGVSVKAVVTDAAGLQAWDEIRLRRETSAQVGRGTVHVLAVGVSNYANPAYNLKYAAADAQAFGSLWLAQQGKQFAKASVTTLVNEGANSQAVLAGLKQVAQAAGPDDVVVLFLSGHGVRVRDDEFYFASRDIDLHKLAQTAVPWTAFRTALAGSVARRVVLFLDACHSATALGGRQAGNEDLAGQLVKGAGAVVFTSSLGSQYSYELDGVKHGAFTSALIEGIGQGKADLKVGAEADGVVNVEELLTYLRVRVPQLTDSSQLPACPLLRDFGEPFPLARVK